MTEDYIQEFYDFWRSVNCPKCKTKNWLYDSHSQRAYQRIPNACECYQCSHKFYVGEKFDFECRYMTELEEYGLETVLKEYLDYDTGVANP